MLRGGGGSYVCGEGGLWGGRRELGWYACGLCWCGWFTVGNVVGCGVRDWKVKEAHKGSTARKVFLQFQIF